jgi:predicted aspartyl protease
VELPVVPDRDFLVVPVTINGVGPFRFVVDSGADLPVIATDVALAAHMKLHGGASVITPAGEFGIISGRIDRLRIGDFVADGVEAGVASMAYLAPFRATHQVDGLLGIGVFRDFLLETDFGRRRVVVERRETARLMGVPFIAYTSPHLLVVAEVAGRRVPAILDTGNSLGFVIPHADSFPLALPLRYDPAGFSAVGSTVPVHGQIGRLQGHIRLGPSDWPDPIIRLQDDSTLGVIGTQALNGLDIGIDARDRRIYFFDR